MINSGRMLSAGEPLDGNERAGSRSGAATAAAFAYAVRSGRLDLPLPGSGWTRERWAALAALAEEDLSLARLAEGHSDADAILAELGASPLPVGTRWGVWAAQPPGPGLIATRIGHGWRLDGIKQYCSGARSCTDALVTGGGDGRPLRAWPRGGRRRLVRRIHLAIGGAVRRDRGRGRIRPAQRKRAGGTSPKTRAEFYEIARQRDLPGRSKMGRDELARRLG
jgi:hypothetical protein